MTERAFGWRPPLPDAVEQPQFSSAVTIMPFALPMSVDLRPGFPHKPWDQGPIGSCTAFAACGLAHFLMRKAGKTPFLPSRLAEYYWTRASEGNAQWDSGASVRGAMWTMNRVGVAHESLWWYNPAKFAVKPNQTVVADAAKTKVVNIYQVSQTPSEIKTCLSMGYPVNFGFTVYSSFNRIGSNGVMPMPTRGEQILGGHSVLMVGYDDSKGMITCRNSWSTDWGDGGYFYMPYMFAFSPGYASDFWTAHGISMS